MDRTLVLYAQSTIARLAGDTVLSPIATTNNTSGTRFLIDGEAYKIARVLINVYTDAVGDYVIRLRNNNTGVDLYQETHNSPNTNWGNVVVIEGKDIADIGGTGMSVIQPAFSSTVDGPFVRIFGVTIELTKYNKF